MAVLSVGQVVIRWPAVFRGFTPRLLTEAAINCLAMAWTFAFPLLTVVGNLRHPRHLGTLQLRNFEAATPGLHTQFHHVLLKSTLRTETRRHLIWRASIPWTCLAQGAGMGRAQVLVEKSSFLHLTSVVVRAGPARPITSAGIALRSLISLLPPTPAVQELLAGSRRRGRRALATDTQLHIRPVEITAYEEESRRAVPHRLAHRRRPPRFFPSMPSETSVGSTAARPPTKHPFLHSLVVATLLQVPRYPWKVDRKLWFPRPSTPGQSGCSGVLRCAPPRMRKRSPSRQSRPS